MRELMNEEFDRYRRIAHICAGQLPEPFAVDALLMIYQICVAYDLSPAELTAVFGAHTLAFIEAGALGAPAENPAVTCNFDMTWDRPFVVTEIGVIGTDGKMRRVVDQDLGGNAYLFQELFRKRRSGN